MLEYSVPPATSYFCIWNPFFIRKKHILHSSTLLWVSFYYDYCQRTEKMHTPMDACLVVNFLIHTSSLEVWALVFFVRIIKSDRKWSCGHFIKQRAERIRFSACKFAKRSIILKFQPPTTIFVQLNHPEEGYTFPPAWLGFLTKKKAKICNKKKRTSLSARELAFRHGLWQVLFSCIYKTSVIDGKTIHWHYSCQKFWKELLQLWILLPGLACNGCAQT